MSRPRHVGLVAIGGANWMGGVNYVRNLATAIRSAAPDTAISWICGDPLRKDWRDVAPRIDVRSRDSLWSRLLRPRKASLSELLERTGIEFIYPLTYDNQYNLGLSFPIGDAIGKRGWAGWIPDFQHRYLPELFSQQEIDWRDAQIAKLAAEAPTVVLSSRTALDDFRKFLSAEAGKGRVLSFAVPPIDRSDDASMVGEAPERFFLVCNQFWKHKNHLTLFEALRILRSRGVTPPVLCTGQLKRNYRDGDYDQVICAKLAECGLESQVQLLGLVPRARQIALIRRAVAMIQPSLFEGWSTVVEDARVLGRPCLLSDLPVHREQNPPGARYFSPQSAENLADVIAAAWTELPPGPDPKSEATACDAAARRLAEVGREFLALPTGL